MANCHVAHDCVIGSDVVIANGTLMGGFVSIDDRAFISGAVTLHQFCRVGRLAMVAASARVNQDCLPFIVTDGVPARARGLNLVGLKRAGLDTGEIRELKRAYHALRSGLQLEAVLQDLGASSSSSVGELVRFIRASKRGFAHVAS
ncbi:MAG: acyl-ACP--UDP-N-acetylglucosamine O-acyltransferase, partial [Burkholderiales bacterium]